MMEPVTTGGKKRSIRLITGARKIEITPAPITAPNSARAPSAPGAAPAMATMGPTAAKVTPIITGILTPSQAPAPSDWMIEAMPHIRAAHPGAHLVLIGDGPDRAAGARSAIAALYVMAAAARHVRAALARLPAGPDAFDVHEARARFAAALSMAA